jgi:hypothetical protein
VKLEPKNASFHYALGRLYRKTGDGESAKRELGLSKQMYGEKASPSGQDLPKPPEGVPLPFEVGFSTRVTHTRLARCKPRGCFSHTNTGSASADFEIQHTELCPVSRSNPGT